jgi:hypothetical protein
MLDSLAPLPISNKIYVNSDVDIVVGYRTPNPEYQVWDTDDLTRELGMFSEEIVLRTACGTRLIAGTKFKFLCEPSPSPTTDSKPNFLENPRLLRQLNSISQFN